MRNIDSGTLTNETFPRWHSFCVAANIFQHAAGMGDMLSIFAITFDRFLFINFPLRYDSIMTKHVAVVIVILIFTISTSFTLFMLLLSDVLRKGMECSMFNVLAPVFTFGVWMPLSGLGTILITAFYGKIAMIAMSKRSATPQDTSGSNQVQGQARVTKVMAVVIGVYIFTYGEWFTVFFVTSGTDTYTVDVLQSCATWLWQVGYS